MEIRDFQRYSHAFKDAADEILARDLKDARDIFAGMKKILRVKIADLKDAT